jgi:hypothetical protein
MGTVIASCWRIVFYQSETYSACCYCESPMNIPAVLLCKFLYLTLLPSRLAQNGNPYEKFTYIKDIALISQTL